MSAPVAPLVGRANEQAQLDQLVENVSRGGTGALLLVGEAGIGKSVLASYATDAANHRGTRTALGQGVPLTIEQPLQPVVGALGRLGGAIALRGRSLIEATIGDPVSLLLQQAVDQLDLLAAGGPILLVLEDLQWADRATLTLVHHLATREHAPALGVVATARLPQPGTPLHHLLAGLPAEVIRLAPLTDGDIDDLAERRLGRPPGPALHQLLCTGDGNPMLAESLLDGLVAGGLIGEDAAIAEIGVQTMVTPAGAIVAQVASVPLGVLRALQLMAITASPARIDLVARTSGRRPTDVLADLETAVAAGVLRSHGMELSFRHDLYRSAVLATVPASGLQALHLDVARELQVLGAPSLEIAEHLAQGARPGNRDAIARLTSTAEEVVGHDPPTALRLTDLALGLVAEPEIPLELQVVRVGALASCGQCAEADLLGRALLRRALAPAVERRVCRDLAIAAFLGGRGAEAHEHMNRVVEIASDPADAAKARTELAWAQFVGLDPVAARAGASIGAEAAESATRIAALSLQCWLGLWALDVKMARGAAIVLSELVTTTPRGEWQVFQPMLAAAAVWLELGRLDECRAAVERGRALADASGTTWAGAAYDVMEASVEMRIGDLDAATELARAALEGTAIVDGFGVEVWSRAVLAQIHLWRGEIAAAEQHVEAAQLALADGRAQLGLDQLIVAEAELRTRQGELPAAVDVLANGWLFLDAIGSRYVRGPTGVALLRVGAALGDRTREDDVAEALAGAAERSGLPGLAADAERAAAWRSRTHESIEASLDAVRALEQPLLELVALRDAIAIASLGGVTATKAWVHDESVLATKLGLARAASDTASVPRHDRSGPRGDRPSFGIDSLTGAERRVAALVAEGLTNAQIAAQLIVSRRTVDTQVLAAYRKLGVRSRVELTRILLGH